MITVSNLLHQVPPLFADLAKLLSGEIDCSQKTLLAYSYDGSPYTIRPQAVIFPKNTADIKYTLSFAREYSMPVTTRGKGTARSGGSLGEGIIIDMSRYFTHIRQMHIMDHTITVDAGVSVRELRTKLHGLEMDIPLLTAYDNDATIGGILSTKSATPTSFRHGTIREWVEALTVVVDTGEEHRIADGITPSGRLLGIYQSVFPILANNAPTLRAAKPETHDDATGYCLWNTSIGPRQLIDELVGSEGTLGIITSVTLRLVPRKPHIQTTCIPLHDLKLLTSCIEIAKHYTAEHIFLYDRAFIELSTKYRPGLLPEFGDTSYVLLVTHTSNDKELLHGMLRNFIQALPVSKASLVSMEDGSFIERVTDREFLFTLINEYTRSTQIISTLADGIIVPLRFYDDLLATFDEYLSSLGKLYVITGNAASGHISVITLFDPRSPHYEEEMSKYAQSMFGFIKKYKGGISATGGEGLLRTPFLSHIYNEEALALFQKIKDAWDPRAILNPGKKLSVTNRYLREHLLHTADR